MTLRTALAFAGGALALAGCSDLAGFGFAGRWAAEGLELRASTLQSELRLPCATVASTPPLNVDSAGRFELSDIASHTYGSFVVIVRGTFVRDTIQTDVTTLAQGAPPHTRHYVLVRDGDPGFERFACLGSTRVGAA